MNHNKLNFPFKRYQVQPVWRADRPQKGRYREFFQCDADVVGSNSLLNEVELANIYSTVFAKLGIQVDIKLNHRKLLTALAELAGGANKMIDITIAIDKLDKIGLEKVKEELIEKGLTKENVTIIESYLNIDGTNEEKISQIKSLLGHNAEAKKGIAELEYVSRQSAVSDSRLTTHDSGLPTPDSRLLTPASRLTIDFTLARGLNYYTGTIFEVKANGVTMGSIGGGGRYDDLTGLFGVPGIPGVGISFGVDRIYDVMEELNLFPSEVHTGTQVLFFNLGEAESKAAFGLMQQLRGRNVRCELYHENVKFDKQFRYAEKKNIPYIIIIGSKELEEKTCVIKDIRKGEQQSLSLNNIAEFPFI
jgi:histidyl-tRNA synthetase